MKSKYLPQNIWRNDYLVRYIRDPGCLFVCFIILPLLFPTPVIHNVILPVSVYDRFFVTLFIFKATCNPSRYPLLLFFLMLKPFCPKEQNANKIKKQLAMVSAFRKGFPFSFQIGFLPHLWTPMVFCLLNPHIRDLKIYSNIETQYFLTFSLQSEISEDPNIHNIDDVCTTLLSTFPLN